MLLTDWRNGSFAILLALGVLLVGHALAARKTGEGTGPVEGTDDAGVNRD